MLTLIKAQAWKYKSIEDSTPAALADYPRKDLVRYRPQHEAKNYQKTVELTFCIEKGLADKINKEVFGGNEMGVGNCLENQAGGLVTTRHGVPLFTIA